jgi:primosomal protein N'
MGTNMIAKSHDIPNFMLVRVATNVGLWPRYFRAPRAPFKLLIQSAGRAGRDLPPLAFRTRMGSGIAVTIYPVGKSYLTMRTMCTR